MPGIHEWTIIIIIIIIIMMIIIVIYLASTHTYTHTYWKVPVVGFGLHLPPGKQTHTHFLIGACGWLWPPLTPHSRAAAAAGPTAQARASTACTAG